MKRSETQVAEFLKTQFPLSKSGATELSGHRRGPKVDDNAVELACLQRENKWLQEKLERAELIIDVHTCPGGRCQGKSCAAAWNTSERQRPFDRLRTTPERGLLIQSAEAFGKSVGVQAACAALIVPRSSLYRARALQAVRNSPKISARTLEPGREIKVREELNSERFQDQSPREVYATLMDEGRYLCSWRSMYRILDENREVRERRDQLRHPNYTKPELLATAPIQLWSWDITKLLGPSKWTYFYLYVILDVFSRYVVGSRSVIAGRESAVLAEELISQTCARQGIERGQPPDTFNQVVVDTAGWHCRIDHHGLLL